MRTGPTIDYRHREFVKDLAEVFSPVQTNARNSPFVVEVLEPKSMDEFFIETTEFYMTGHVFCIRMTLLRDATLLCFGISHHLADGKASFDVISAFCDLLSARNIPSFQLPPDIDGGRMSHLVVHHIQDRSEGQIDCDTHRANFTAGFGPILLVMFSAMWNLLLPVLSFRDLLEERFVYLPYDWVLNPESDDRSTQAPRLIIYQKAYTTPIQERQHQFFLL